MLKNIPARLPLAHLPTPIEKLERLSQAFEGPEIYVKRDDLTGIAKTGNKVRKLEYLVAEAQREQCDLLITCGGAQSNHARATAFAAAKCGIKSQLVLRDGGGGDVDGNLFIDRLVGAEIHFIPTKDYEHVDSIMAKLAEEHNAQGGKAYVIPEGGSNALGALGYVAAMEELARQMKTLRIEFDHMICAVGSGGTLAGMLLGRSLHEIKAEVHGVNVCDDAPYFQNRIFNLLAEAKSRYGFALHLKKDDIHVIDGYVGKGYGLCSQEEIALIKQAARLEGLLLDPVYTGKAMFALMDLIRKGRFQRGEKILFWHTGGIFGLFPKKALFF